MLLVVLGLCVQVTYDIKGFMDKNKDLLFKDLSQAMFASDQMLLRTLFPEGDPEAAHLKRPPTTGKQFKVRPPVTSSPHAQRLSLGSLCLHSDGL